MKLCSEFLAVLLPAVQAGKRGPAFLRDFPVVGRGVWFSTCLEQSGAECLCCQPEHSDLPGLILPFLLLTADSNGVLQADFNVKDTEI